MKGFLLIILLSIHLFSKDSIKLLTEAWPPYQIETSKGLKGISIDLIKEIQKRIGNKEKINVFPWKRAYHITLQKKGYALFLTAKSKNREKLFKWVGPVASLKFTFFKNANNADLNITSLEDAKRVNTIVVDDDTISYEKLKEFGFNNLDTNLLPYYSLNKLIKGKADLYPAEYYTLSYKLTSMKLENKVIPVKMTKPIFESQLYIAFNIDTEDHIINKWQKALDEIKTNGTYPKIVNKYK